MVGGTAAIVAPAAVLTTVSAGRFGALHQTLVGRLHPHGSIPRRVPPQGPSDTKCKLSEGVTKPDSVAAAQEERIAGGRGRNRRSGEPDLKPGTPGCIRNAGVGAAVWIGDGQERFPGSSAELLAAILHGALQLRIVQSGERVVIPSVEADSEAGGHKLGYSFARQPGVNGIWPCLFEQAFGEDPSLIGRQSFHCLPEHLDVDRPLASVCWHPGATARPGSLEIGLAAPPAAAVPTRRSWGRPGSLHRRRTWRVRLPPGGSALRSRHAA